MIDWVITFFALFFTNVFYVFYLKYVEKNKPFWASIWAAIIFFVASVAFINYVEDHWLLIPAGAGAFAGTYVGMIIRKKHGL